MITIQDLFWLIPSASVLALVFAGVFFYRMKAQDEGNEVMRMIAKHVRSGAMAYLRQQYKIVAIFFVLITVVFAFLAYCLHIQNPWVPFAFISGGFFSGLAGYIGMKTATYASGRVANACRPFPGCRPPDRLPFRRRSRPDRGGPRHAGHRRLVLDSGLVL